MKKIKISIVLFLIIILCSCGIKGKLHTEEEIEEYVDELECNKRTHESCNLKGRYKLVKIQETDSERTLILNVKDTDLEFEAKSYPACTGSIDGSCFESTYTIDSNYGTKAYNYLIDLYNKKINYKDELCYKYTNDSECSYSLQIKDKQDLEYFLIYYRVLIEYKNKKKIVLPESTISIVVPSNNRNNYLDIGIEYIKGKYYPYYSSQYVPLDGNIETYIGNFLKINGIELK